MLDTPGSNDPSEVARVLSNMGLYSNIVLLLFRAKDIAAPELELQKTVKTFEEQGASARIYITHVDEESDLTEEGIAKRRKDYAERLECEESHFRLVSFSNNAGQGGRTCKKRSQELRKRSVLDAADVVEDLLQLVEESDHASGEVLEGLREYLHAKTHKLRTL